MPDYVRYIYKLVEVFAVQGINFSEEEVQAIIEKYDGVESSFEELKRSIVETVREEAILKRKEELREELKTIGEKKTLQNIDISYNGITLNLQDIDLMMIAGSNSPEELASTLERITNIKYRLESTQMSDEEFIRKREEVFSLYLESLIVREDNIKNPSMAMFKRIEFLRKSGVLTDSEVAELNLIVAKKSSISEKVREMNETFPDKVHDIALTLKEYEPVGKEGITSMSVERSRRLLDQVRRNYNSITIDEEAKYGNIVLSDGTFDFRDLDKSLEFARSLGKEVRLNTFIFYMDCPSDIYELAVGEESKRVAKEKLLSYVDATTKHIADNYKDVVRSIDVFNELLCRFALDDGSFRLRSDIPQDLNSQDFDNINSGWMKHLSIEDLCDVIAVARRNLPNVDFMYNDDHLINGDKLDTTEVVLARIRKYEEEHGIKLIDSIGTQMHIEDDVTGKDIREMFERLSKYGLPIEVTEFDLAMTSTVDGLTAVEIETLRAKKIDEIHRIIDEVKERCDIRGFTIWSKTDSQNFRVHLDNMSRHARGEEMIETLHGGFFSEDMEVKTHRMSKLGNYNYHTHTKRSGHGAVIEDSVYIDAARMAGVSQLGFTEHVPLTSLEYTELDKRMDISEVNEYIASIRKLRDDNPDMEILCGFEAEYDPMKIHTLCELREKCDYMILGQHFVKDGMRTVKSDGNPEFPISYAKSLCEAMRTGIYDIVAHPDLFMQYRDTMRTEEDKTRFDEAARIASQMICEEASKMQIPLEINLSHVNGEQVYSDGKISYLHPVFWEVASQYDVKVLYGVDAHYAGSLVRREEMVAKAENIIDTSNLQFVEADFNPVKEREKNIKLNQAYDESRDMARTYETCLVEEVLRSVSEGIDGESAEVGDELSARLTDAAKRLDAGAIQKYERIQARCEEISKSDVSDAEKAYLLERTKLEASGIDRTIQERGEAIQRAVESIGLAQSIGCETVDEYIYVVGEITEAKTQTDEAKVSVASENVASFQEQKSSGTDQMFGDTNGTSSTPENNQDKPKVYTYTNTQNNGSSGDNGSAGGEGGFTASLPLLYLLGILTIVSIIMVRYFIK